VRTTCTEVLLGSGPAGSRTDDLSIMNPLSYQANHVLDDENFVTLTLWDTQNHNQKTKFITKAYSL